MILTKKDLDMIKSLLASGLSPHKKIRLSPDLGKSFHEYNLELFKDILFDKLKDNFLYYFDVETREIFPLAIFDKHFYKMELSKSGVPYLVIDGFRMHLQNFSPLDYARKLVKKLSPKGKVLDCFGGFGYVSIELSKVVNKVYYIEKNEAVLSLARLNPYSQDLFVSDNIEIINKDIIDFLDSSKDEKFDFIVSDAPSFRYKEARHFYSRKFLLKLLNPLKEGGRLYFYTGRIAKDIIKKYLDEFSLKYEFDEQLLGYFIIKTSEIKNPWKARRVAKRFKKRRKVKA